MACAAAAAGQLSRPPGPISAGRRRCLPVPAVTVVASTTRDDLNASSNASKGVLTDSLNITGQSTHHKASSSLDAIPNTRESVYQPESYNLRFDRLRPLSDEWSCKHKRVFGRYIAREALLDEEYWTAAWLRAESHYEDQQGVRFVESLKRKYASKEFEAVRKRCLRDCAEKCICLVAVINDELKRTVLSSIVGTLDVSVRRLLHGERYPGVSMKVPQPFCRIYQTDQPKVGYISNLIVSKYARRRRIASNLLSLAVDAARSYGAQKTYVQVHRSNIPAQRLYEEMGFKMVETEDSRQSELFLLCF